MSDANVKPPYHIEFTMSDGLRMFVAPSEFLVLCELLGYAPPFTIVMEQPL